MINFFEKRAKSINEILHEISRYDYVSFDIFDTLLKRNVPSAQTVFDLIEIEGEKMYGNTISGFSANRRYAERDVRKASAGEEVSLDDIYRKLGDYYSKEMCVWLQNKEVDLEYLLCTRNSRIYEVYQFCLQHGKKIIITSDMYLPEDSIIRMLNKCGICKWDYLFISCVTKRTKKTGSMYEHILGLLQIRPDEIIHLGDNWDSDFIQPKKKKIASLFIRGNCSYVCYPKPSVCCIFDECAKIFINNTISEIEESMQLGYECFGPLLFGFTIWLMKELHNNEIHAVYFLSRDGYILKKAFDILNNGKGDIESHYLYASRRAYRVPILAEGLTYEEFIDRNFWEENITARSFAKAMGVEDLAEIDFLLKDIQDYSIEKKDLNSDPTMQKIYYDILNIISPRVVEEEEALYKYLEQERFGEKRTAIVDIGWHGNMQLNLLDVLRKKKGDLDLRGYYIGISPHDNHKEKIMMKGYIFDEGLNEDLYYREIDASFHILLEQVFMAPHGSVKSFHLENGAVKVSFYDNEQKNEKSICILEDYQSGALQFVKKFKCYQNIFYLSVNFSIDALIKQFNFPQIQDVKRWENIVFKDSDEKQLIYNHGQKYYFLHPMDLWRDYRKSVWKVGYLKKIFRCNLNYSQMIRVCEKIYIYIFGIFKK